MLDNFSNNFTLCLIFIGFGGDNCSLHSRGGHNGLINYEGLLISCQSVKTNWKRAQLVLFLSVGNRFLQPNAAFIVNFYIGACRPRKHVYCFVFENYLLGRGGGGPVVSRVIL